MNILIADSGSTKTAWILLSENGKKEEFFTTGLSPNFNTAEQMAAIIREGLLNKLEIDEIGSIFFYGTGCGPESRKLVVKQALQQCFKHVPAEVHTDLLAAARASLGRKPGVACILGTGSNTGLYDGEHISRGVPSLGFTLADEGSGGYFGKKILNSYFYQTMPQELRIWLEAKYDMRIESVLDSVYLQARPNRFVATFTHLIGVFADHKFVQAMVRQGFEEFADNQLGYLGDISGLDIGFVGSIAEVHHKILKTVLESRGLVLGNIIQKPIEQLTEYHADQAFR